MVRALMVLWNCTKLLNAGRQYALVMHSLKIMDEVAARMTMLICKCQ